MTTNIIIKEGKSEVDIGISHDFGASPGLGWYNMFTIDFKKSEYFGIIFDPESDSKEIISLLENLVNSSKNNINYAFIQKDNRLSISHYESKLTLKSKHSNIYYTQEETLLIIQKLDKHLDIIRNYLIYKKYG